MMKELDEDILEKIDAYLDGNMSKEEHDVFLKNMDSDEELNKQVESVRQVRAGIKSFHFRNNLKQNSKKFQESATKPNYTAYLLSGIAASIILIISFNLVFQNNSDRQLLFAEYFEPYPYLGAPRGEANLDDLGTAYRSYVNRNYKEAVESFQRLAKEQLNIPKNKFYLGVSYMGAGDMRSAITNFESILSESIYHQQTQWYLGLCYIKLEDWEKAQYYLKLIDPDTELGKQAEALISSIAD
ncbi:MAG: hypothetical protein NXI20_00420 [bacterium]|nr:hypothetical protein [bacterium]